MKKFKYILNWPKRAWRRISAYFRWKQWRREHGDMKKNIDQVIKARPQTARYIKILIIVLQFLAVGLMIYLVVLPFYPVLKYKLSYNEPAAMEEAKNIEAVKRKTAEIKQEIKQKTEQMDKEFNSALPVAEYSVSPNRVIIPKIGVNAPIVEAKSAEYGLSLGAWRVPESSTPDKGGNTVITGHRFKYLPPNNLTFYLFHKLEAGDLVSIIYKEQDYFYKIKEVKIVDKTEMSIMAPTDEPILTLFTCHPIYSVEQRLVVVAEPIST